MFFNGQLSNSHSLPYNNNSYSLSLVLSYRVDRTISAAHAAVGLLLAGEWPTRVFCDLIAKFIGRRICPFYNFALLYTLVRFVGWLSAVNETQVPFV